MENPHYRELRLVKQTEQHNAGTVPRFMSSPRECRGMAVAAHISSRLIRWHSRRRREADYDRQFEQG